MWPRSRKHASEESESMHRTALDRLRRDWESRAEYVRVRVNRGLASTLDAWGEDADPRPPRKPQDDDTGR
jgi:hypothetical protein